MCVPMLFHVVYVLLHAQHIRQWCIVTSETKTKYRILKEVVKNSVFKKIGKIGS